MAKRKTTEITSEKVSVLGQDFRRVIRYDAEHETFYASLPKYVAEVLGDGDAGGKTQDDLRKDWDVKIKEYEAKVKTQRKVILFHVDSEVKQQEGRKYDPESHNSHGCDVEFKGKIEFEFLVAIEFTAGKVKEYKDVYGNHISGYHHNHLLNNGSESGVARGAHLVDWTQEREDFFRNMMDAMAKLKAKLDGFFVEDTAAIALMIDKSHGNLLGFDGDKK